MGYGMPGASPFTVNGAPWAHLSVAHFSFSAKSPRIELEQIACPSFSGNKGVEMRRPLKTSSFVGCYRTWHLFLLRDWPIFFGPSQITSFLSDDAMELARHPSWMAWICAAKVIDGLAKTWINLARVAWSCSLDRNAIVCLTVHSNIGQSQRFALRMGTRQFGPLSTQVFPLFGTGNWASRSSQGGRAEQIRPDLLQKSEDMLM